MDITLDALHQLGLPAVSAVVLVVAALALVVLEPVTGRRSYRTFLARLGSSPDGQEAVRVQFYRRWTAQGWAIGAAAVLLVVALPGVGVEDLGLRLPRLDGLGIEPSRLVGVLVGALVGLGIAFGILVVAARRTRSPDAPRVVGNIEPMLPRSAPERRAWSGLALSAGVTEEITYRGLLLIALAVLLPDAQPLVVVVAAGVLFGLAHWYQGPAGIVGTAVLGGALAALYLATGSLLLPMALHVLIDLRVLVQLPAARRATAT